MALSRGARTAVFLDKDGTLLSDVPYNADPSQMVLAPGAAEGLRLLAGSGHALVVVSNQPGVALGLFHPRALRDVWRCLDGMFRSAGARMAGFYWCPHHPQGLLPQFRQYCSCRKPGPGMLQRAAGDLNLDLAASWMVGDILDDVEAGRAAGCQSVLLDVGSETQWRDGPLRRPHARVADLAAAAQLIALRERP